MFTKKYLFISILLLFILFCFLTFPLISHCFKSIPYTYSTEYSSQTASLIQGDHIQLMYTMWLMHDFIHHPRQFFYDHYQFSVSWIKKIFTTRETPSSLIFSLSTPWGYAFAYNMTLLISFILCGLFTSLLIYHYIPHRFIAFIGGTVFTLFPFHMTQLIGGHPNGICVLWLPLAIVLYEKLWQTHKAYYGLLAGICIFLMNLEDFHLGYYMALFTAFFWLYKIITIRPRITIKELVYITTPVLGSWIIITGYMVFLKFFVIGKSIIGAGRSINEAALFAPQLSDTFNRINTYNAERYIYLGIPTVILSIAALIMHTIHTRKKTISNTPLYFAVFVFLGSLLLSYGPNFSILPLYQVCRKIIPFFSIPRSTGRIITFTHLYLSILASYGLYQLIRLIKRPARQYSLLVCCLIFIIVDFKPVSPIGITALPEKNDVYEYLQKNNPEGPLLEIPLWPGDSSWTSIYQYYTMLYRIPMINGYSAMVSKDYINTVFWPLVSLDMGIIGKQEYEQLNKMNISYILMHEEAYPHKVSPFPFQITLKNMKNSPYVTVVKEIPPLYLFSVNKDIEQDLPAQQTYPSQTGLLYECEHMPHAKQAHSEYDIAASNNTALKTDVQQSKNNPIDIVFGPWKLFPPGNYTAEFRLKGTYTQKVKPIEIEVVTNHGKDRITGKSIKTLSPTYNSCILPFTITKTQQIEFRILSYGNCSVWTDYIYIITDKTPDPIYSFEAEEVFHIGNIIIDNQAHNNKAVYATPTDTPAQRLIYGQQRKYQPGTYRILFRIKTSEIQAIPLCTIAVKHPFTTNSIIEKIIYAQDLIEPNRYKEFELKVTLDNPSFLDFQVYYHAKAPIYVDSITITPEK